MAAKSDHGIYRLGAVVLSNGKIVGRGYNRSAVNGKLIRRGYFSTHAECAAIVNARGTGDTLVVVRVARKDKSHTCSKPCDRCMIFAKENGIKKIYFSDWNNKVELIKL